MSVRVQAYASTNGVPPVLDSASLHILRHALGLSSGGTEYRNHFVTGPGSKDYDACMALVEVGYMRRRDGSPLTGGDDLFTVTDAGREAASVTGAQS